MSETITNRPVIAYIRVSSSRQVDEGNSPDTQRQRIEACAMSKGWQVDKFYTDLARSGKSVENRPQLQLALKHACDTHGILIFYALSRISRSQMDSGVIAERLNKSGVDMVSTTEPIDTTSALGRAFYGFIAVMNQLGRELIAENTQAGMNYLKDHNMRTGTIPYGWVSDGGLLVPNNDEQLVIARMQTMRASGSGYRAIATALNADGIPSKSAGLIRKGAPVSGRWCPQSVQSVLKYASERAVNNVAA